MGPKAVRVLTAVTDLREGHGITEGRKGGLEGAGARRKRRRVVTGKLEGQEEDS